MLQFLVQSVAQETGFSLESPLQSDTVGNRYFILQIEMDQLENSSRYSLVQKVKQIAESKIE